MYEVNDVIHSVFNGILIKNGLGKRTGVHNSTKGHKHIMHYSKLARFVQIAKQHGSSSTQVTKMVISSRGTLMCKWRMRCK